MIILLPYSCASILVSFTTNFLLFLSSSIRKKILLRTSQFRSNSFVYAIEIRLTQCLVSTQRNCYLNISFFVSFHVILCKTLLLFVVLAHVRSRTLDVHSCPVGFKASGRECVNDNECLFHPCQNGGRCRDHHPPRKYECICTFGFTGQHCDMELSATFILVPSFTFIVTLIACASTLIRKYPEIVQQFRSVVSSIISYSQLLYAIRKRLYISQFQRCTSFYGI